MPDIFFMFVVFGLLIAMWGFVLLLHIFQKTSDFGNKVLLGAVLVYLVERFKK